MLLDKNNILQVICYHYCLIKKFHSAITFSRALRNSGQMLESEVEQKML